MATRFAMMTLALGIGMGGCASRPMDSNTFLAKAAQGGMAEVQLSQLALQRAGNEQVRQFAQRMVDDHTRTNQELSQLAGRRSVSLPMDVSGSQRSEYERLSKLSGAEFDKQYMSLSVKDHEMTLKDFGAQSEKGSDAEVRAFAAKTLPALQGHLDMAREMDGHMKP